ncbi:uncharacterized protein LOC144035371 isoform X1 [Vanacampus margaritifer]
MFMGQFYFQVIQYLSIFFFFFFWVAKFLTQSTDVTRKWTTQGRSLPEDGVAALPAGPVRRHLSDIDVFQRLLRRLRGGAVRPHPRVLGQCLVQPARLRLQRHPAAPARLPLQGGLLGPRCGAAPRHGARLLRPPLAVVTDERSGNCLMKWRRHVCSSDVTRVMQGCEGWTVCSRCETYRPPRAHHCRVCQRCIRRMDHHCPWINNCVGELNQKYFIQFLFYTGVASVYAMLLVVSAWVWRIRSERDGEGEAEDSPAKHLIVAHYIVLLVESVLFGVFVLVIFYDQLASIIADETPIEQMRNRLMMMKDRGSSSSPPSSPPPSHHATRKPKLALLREVFGRGSVFCWLLPLYSGGPSVGGGAYSALPDYDV